MNTQNVQFFASLLFAQNDRIESTFQMYNMRSLAGARDDRDINDTLIRNNKSGTFRKELAKSRLNKEALFGSTL